jgi:hypothetical protein
VSEEVDLTTSLSDDGSRLGVFLHHPDLDGRREVEDILLKQGAEFTTYPDGKVPPLIDGSVTVEDANITLITGSLYVIGALEVPSGAVRSASHAILYSLQRPFAAGDLTEKTVLSASLPLNIERGSQK